MKNKLTILVTILCLLSLVACKEVEETPTHTADPTTLHVHQSVITQLNLPLEDVGFLESYIEQGDNDDFKLYIYLIVEGAYVDKTQWYLVEFKDGEFTKAEEFRKPFITRGLGYTDKIDKRWEVKK